jgi:poly-gamma-glutamate capsule biosynthesis protein CapA/YwtB (metallophosphatase superfamily)
MLSRFVRWFLPAALCAACSAATTVPGPQATPAASPLPAASAAPSATPALAPATATEPAAPTAAAPATNTPPSASPTAPPTIHLLFTGDISPGRCVYETALKANDMAWPYRLLAGLLRSADIAVGSLDASLSDQSPPVPCTETRNLMAPAASAQGLQFAGFKVITVATNHIKDCGVEHGCVNQSLFDTLDNLRRAGISPVGAGHTLTEAVTPVIIDVQGVRFAFLGFSAIASNLWATATTPGTAPFSPEVYLAAIRQARAQADVVIVLPHWGTEYAPEINWEQYQAAPLMVEAGATLIVGNHPHRVQGMETFANGAVAVYALGNFVFDQQWSDNTQYTQEGMLLLATFSGSQLQAVQLLPVAISKQYQPQLAPLQEGREILRQAEDALAPLPPRATPSPAP